jgi:hypothetical protein
MLRARLPLAPILTALVAAPLLAGCISTAAKVVTAPVRIVSKGTDWATTSQSESDRNRGREIRRREERLGKLQRDYDRHRRQCADGNAEACDRAHAEYGEIQYMMPTVPLERD